MSERVRPDQFYYLNPENGGEPFMVNAKYDSMHHFSWLGHWVLKVYDDEVGLMGLHIDEPTAKRIVAYAELPIVEREFIYQSEYEAYLQAQEKMMDGWNE